MNIINGRTSLVLVGFELTREHRPLFSLAIRRPRSAQAPIHCLRDAKAKRRPSCKWHLHPSSPTEQLVVVCISMRMPYTYISKSRGYCQCASTEAGGYEIGKDYCVGTAGMPLDLIGFAVATRICAYVAPSQKRARAVHNAPRFGF